MSGRVLLSCGVAAARNARVLLLLKKHPPHRGRWTLPGGEVERSEPVIAAANRALAETGLTARSMKLLTYSDEIRPGAGGAERWVALLFTAETSGTPRLGDSARYARLKWVDIDAPPADLTPQTAVALAALKRGRAD